MVATRGRPLYVAHLVDDTAFTHDHASGAEPRMHGRLDAFAEIIRAAEGGVSEIVLIGHSSSSFLAVEALDRILASDPDFGRRGTPVSFVTIGSVTPWITLDPLAVKARAALARVAAATAISWLDVRAKWDWLSIHRRDPLRASGLPSPGRGRPIVIHVRLDDRPRHFMWELYARSIGRPDLDVGRGLVFDTAQLAVQYVLSGDGLALVDPILFREALASGRLVQPFPRPLDTGYGYYLTTSPEDLDNEAVALFRSWLIRRFSVAAVP